MRKTPSSPMRPPPGRRVRRGGFSLAELLISVGILGIGLTMSAALFPTALKEYDRSANNVLGTIMCDNGLVRAQSVLNSSQVGDTLEEKFSGSHGGSTKFGYIVFATKATTDSYKLVAVAYRKTVAANTVTAQTISCTTSGTQVSGGGGQLCVNSPLIAKTSGNFAVIIGTDGTIGTLDRDLGTTDPLGYYVIQEHDASSALMRRSPVMFIRATKTGLRE